MEYLTLHNGRRMPALGLGTWDLRGQTCVETIPRALELGYRLIDTAQMYENEREVGQGLRLAGLPREEVWVTTKIFRPDTTYAKAKAAIQRSLDQLALDYIDLLLIHEPYDTAEEMYVALEEAYQAGTLRAIGISNFHEARYQTFLAGCQVVPMVNQVESHVYFLRKDLQRAMAAHGTVTRHYYKHLKGEATSTNPMATIFAWSGALKKRGELDSLPALVRFGEALEAASLQTLNDGIMTKDLCGLAEGITPTQVNSEEFIQAIRTRLEAKLA